MKDEVRQVLLICKFSICLSFAAINIPIYIASYICECKCMIRDISYQNQRLSMHVAPETVLYGFILQI